MKCRVYFTAECEPASTFSTSTSSTITPAASATVGGHGV